MKKLLLMTLLSLALLQASSQTEKLYELSGAKATMHAMPVTFEVALDEAFQEDPNMAKLPPQLKQKLLQLPQVFTAKKLDALMLKSLAKNINTQETKKIVSWLKTSLGKRIVKAEVDVTKKTVMKKMTAFSNAFKISSVAKKRLTVIENLKKAMNYEKKIFGMAVNLASAMAKPMVETLPIEQRPNFQQLRAMMTQSLAQEQAKLFKDLLAGFVFTYKDISNSDLRAYTKFLQTKHGTSYVNGSFSSLDYALSETIKSF